MTLKQFWQNPVLKNADLRVVGFSRLYCRRGRRYINIAGSRRWVNNLLTIANVVARQEQKGAFTRLLDKIDRELGCSVLLENVLNPDFAAALERNPAFVRVELAPGDPTPCFLKLRE